ncbi:MAG: hypothetical protein QW836_10285 [Ignisphaera sp.]
MFVNKEKLIVSTSSGEYVFGPVKISRGSGAGIIHVPKLIAPLLVGKHVIVSLKVVESVIDQPKGD